MPTYKAPVDDALFLLNDVLHFDRYGNLPGFADASPDIVEAVLREAAKFSEEVLTPLNRVGDSEGCTRHADGSVTTPTGFKDAFKQLVEGGWIGISVPAEFGGQGLPATLTEVVNEFLCSANMAFAMYPGLTQGAIAALLAHASPELKKKYLPKMVERRLDRHHEPDRAALRHRSGAAAHQGGQAGATAATRSPAPRFSSRPASTIWPRTSSIWCSRASKARPPAPRAFRCSWCRRSWSTMTARSAQRNGVVCGSIEEKMGIHGNSTCVMNYDGATGWLVGEENRGLPAMFTMMNEARLGVGVQGLAQSEVAYQNAAIYAKERLQGRAITGVEISRQAGRSDHRASGRAPHADDHPRLQRSGARAGAVDRAQERRRASLRGRQGTPERRRPHGPADAGDQRRAHRHRLCQHGDGAADVRRPRLHRRARHGAVRARRAHRADLRRRQRHPGARSGRPQARQGRRPRADGLLQRGRRPTSRKRAPTTR